MIRVSVSWIDLPTVIRRAEAWPEHGRFRLQVNGMPDERFIVCRLVQQDTYAWVAHPRLNTSLGTGQPTIHHPVFELLIPGHGEFYIIDHYYAGSTRATSDTPLASVTPLLSLEEQRPIYVLRDPTERRLVIREPGGAASDPGPVPPEQAAPSTDPSAPSEDP